MYLVGSINISVRRFSKAVCIAEMVSGHIPFNMRCRVSTYIIVSNFTINSICQFSTLEVIIYYYKPCDRNMHTTVHDLPSPLSPSDELLEHALTFTACFNTLTHC